MNPTWGIVCYKAGKVSGSNIAYVVEVQAADLGAARAAVAGLGYVHAAGHTKGEVAYTK